MRIKRGSLCGDDGDAFELSDVFVRARRGLYDGAGGVVQRAS